MVFETGASENLSVELLYGFGRAFAKGLHEELVVGEICDVTNQAADCVTHSTCGVRLCNYEIFVVVSCVLLFRCFFFGCAVFCESARDSEIGDNFRGRI